MPAEPDPPPLQIRVPDVASLLPGQARKFEFERRGERLEGFVLRVPADGDSQLVAYLNQCRHWMVDLDMGEGRFWSDRLQRIVCMTHGAQYDGLTGICDRGPCVGARLERFEIRCDNEDAIVSIPG